MALLGTILAIFSLVATRWPDGLAHRARASMATLTDATMVLALTHLARAWHHLANTWIAHTRLTLR